MLKSLLGIAPRQEPDGSFSPSKLALKTVDLARIRLRAHSSCCLSRQAIEDLGDPHGTEEHDDAERAGILDG